MQNGNAIKSRKRSMLATFLILIVIPLTIACGILLLNDRKYYLISLLIIFYSMLPFGMVFERRRPQARELIVIAVLCAIAVAGRAAFFWIPQFKPVVAIVIIAGVTFGAESGFLVGAMSGFVSNFFFGQGPWTPWQMFCFGIIGFIAGLIFHKNRLPKKRLILCLFGGLSTFFIYGGIINFGALLMWSSHPTWEALIATYLSGVPFDLGHAAATVIFLAILANPMIEKLERIKKKYGLVESR
ncbi:ECF transporter S component [Gottfriedia sp. NPDC056225]|uniref:ECF transporter S component n=1 Tax=Gottfriedia sp. NPDC056225 TaxID=3345751 RepID=UPI00155918C7|nr:ECF transporter S component [Arthrobacter citreus]